MGHTAKPGGTQSLLSNLPREPGLLCSLKHNQSKNGEMSLECTSVDSNRKEGNTLESSMESNRKEASTLDSRMQKNIYLKQACLFKAHIGLSVLF